MSSEPKHEPLDPDLAALLAVERSAVSAPRDAEERVFARLERTTLADSFTPPAVPPKAWRIGSPSAVVGIFALGVAVGVVAARPSPSAATGEAPSVAEGAPSVSASSPVVTPWDLPSSSTPALPSRVAPGAAISALAAPTVPPTSFSAERALLDVARTALVRGDGASSLAAADRHETQFPSGVLSEEREALAVRALVLLERYPEARTRGTRFAQRFPRSVFGPSVEDTLRSIP